MRTRLRFWIGFAAVLVIALGAVGAALIVHDRDSDNYHETQAEEAERAAHQAEAAAELSVGQLSSAAAFFQAEGSLDKHEFEVVAHSLLEQHTLTTTAFVQRVPAAERAAWEAEHGTEITERTDGHLVRASERAVYFPVTYVVSRTSKVALLGVDLSTDRERGPLLERARDEGEAIASPVADLAIGGAGLVVYKPVFRDGAPTSTVAERRAALLGYVGGSFQVRDIAAAAAAAIPGADQVQLRAGGRLVAGNKGELDDAARAPFDIADRTWYLVVSDPNTPEVGLPLLIAVVGVSLAALLGALIFIWSRNERIEELEREASEDPLTGLRNRRRFEADLELAMARARRERTTGALLMLDLDHFKLVNDTHGHQAGDRLIVEVSEALRRRTRESDVLARLGGDEFAVILPLCTVHEARLAAEAIGTAIREHDPSEDGDEPVTASIGIAMFGDRPRTNAASIVSEADAAMYAAKDGGRDTIRVFDREAIRESGSV
jgi:diguanylate cyclase (GGDEF)-like protein